jgi:hypothetical protein
MPCWPEPNRSGRPEPYPPAVEAALRGDTVLALGSSAESLELTLVYGDGPLVRTATGPFRPTVLESLHSQNKVHREVRDRRRLIHQT